MNKKMSQRKSLKFIFINGCLHQKKLEKMNENQIRTYKTYIDITKMVAENIEKVS